MQNSVRNADEIVAVVDVVDAGVARLALISGRALLLRLLGRGDEAKVMLGMLKIAFRRDRIARRLRIARQLEIFLTDMMRRAANFHVGPAQLVGTRQWIWTFAIVGAAAHAFVSLSRSHR